MAARSRAHVINHITEPPRAPFPNPMPAADDANAIAVRAVSSSGCSTELKKCYAERACGGGRGSSQRRYPPSRRTFATSRNECSDQMSEMGLEPWYAGLYDKDPGSHDLHWGQAGARSSAPQPRKRGPGRQAGARSSAPQPRKRGPGRQAGARSSAPQPRKRGPGRQAGARSSAPQPRKRGPGRQAGARSSAPQPRKRGSGRPVGERKRGVRLDRVAQQIKPGRHGDLSCSWAKRCKLPPPPPHTHTPNNTNIDAQLILVRTCAACTQRAPGMLIIFRGSTTPSVGRKSRDAMPVCACAAHGPPALAAA